VFESNTFVPLKDLCYLTYYNTQTESKDLGTYAGPQKLYSIRQSSSNILKLLKQNDKI